MASRADTVVSMEITLTLTTCATCGEIKLCATHPDLHGAICSECWTAEVAYMRAHHTDDEINIDARIAAVFAGHRQNL